LEAVPWLVGHCWPFWDGLPGWVRGWCQRGSPRRCWVSRRGHCAGTPGPGPLVPGRLLVRRETMGRGRRGRRFRRTVAGIPTARFRERLRGMACHAGLAVIAAGPAYASLWGAQHWAKPLQAQSRTCVTRHHGAAVAIGRRGLGYRIRRRPGVTGSHQRMAARRATGQTASVPRPHGTTSPPRTTGTPHAGGKTRWRRGDQLALFPAPQDRSGEHRATRPDSSDPASTGQHRQERSGTMSGRTPHWWRSPT
jgi:hypothetical protein